VYIKDKVLHFFGCLEFRERYRFFSTDDLHPYWQREYHKALSSNNNDSDVAKSLVLDKMIRYANSIHREVERCEKLIKIFSQDADEEHYLECLRKSSQLWMLLKGSSASPLPKRLLTPVPGLAVDSPAPRDPNRVETPSEDEIRGWLEGLKLCKKSESMSP